MTITQALDALTQAWPAASVMINLEVWSHVNSDGRREPEVTWKIWRADTCQHFEHPTLAGAVQTALKPLTLADAEASLTSEVSS